jgi:hypothetical protein
MMPDLPRFRSETRMFTTLNVNDTTQVLGTLILATPDRLTRPEFHALFSFSPGSLGVESLKSHTDSIPVYNQMSNSQEKAEARSEPKHPGPFVCTRISIRVIS